MDIMLKNVKLVVKDAEGETVRGEHPLELDSLVKLNEIIEEMLFSHERGTGMMEEFAMSLYAKLGEPDGKMKDLVLLIDVEWGVEYIPTAAEANDEMMLTPDEQLEALLAKNILPSLDDAVPVLLHRVMIDNLLKAQIAKCRKS